MTYEVDVERAADVLARGGLVAFPTETVYGLGADASQADAVAQIFRVKGRPSTHPLIVHVARVESLSDWARAIPPFAQRLADVLMPGPLTLILPRSPRASDAVTGGRDTVGLRVPAHPLARALIDALGARRSDRHAGIAAPSANRFGSVSPTSAAHVHADLGSDDVAVLDGGPCEVGLESTIVDCASEGSPTILRVGGVPREALEDVLGAPVPLATEGPARAPGMLAAHYAPRAKVIVASEDTFEDEVRRAVSRGRRVASLGPRAGLGASLELVTAADPRERARTLYATLRELDARGAEEIVVALPPATGLGLAIADRLTRASRA
ncbi:MAG: L-threonylcarbamoyladenylate synthase [Sandaracinus sp.]